MLAGSSLRAVCFGNVMKALGVSKHDDRVARAGEEGAICDGAIAELRVTALPAIEPT